MAEPLLNDLGMHASQQRHGRPAVPKTTQANRRQRVIAELATAAGNRFVEPSAEPFRVLMVAVE